MSWTSISLSLTSKPSPAVSESLEQENARLKAEVERLERLVNYWKIEANCDHDRWLRVLADLDDLRRNMK